MKNQEEQSPGLRIAQLEQELEAKALELELKKRELEIEVALERVRARTMAMQKSDELAETVSLLFKQLLGLGISQEQIRTCGIVTFNDNEPIGEQWITETNGEVIPQSFIVPYNEAPAYISIYESWKKGEKFKVIHLEGESLTQHFGYLEKHTNVPVRDVVERRKAKEIYNHVLYFSQGCLFIITKEALPEYHEVFKRFGTVFQQSYTRFLDLKHAEEQAREAKIEAALERVRGKTMAMHNSQDVGDTVATMFDELVKLGVEKTIRCGILIIGSSKHMEVWTASSNPNGEVGLNIGRIDMMVHPMLQGIHNAWKTKQTDFSYEMIGEDLKNYYQAINDSPDYPAQFEIASLPSKQMLNVFFFPDGGIFVFSPGPFVSETAQVFKKFAGVFALTYRRFLDLQRAETQAREARIEASLERVRSKAMAMRDSNDLLTAASTVFTELHNLGINQIRSGVGLIAKEFHKAKVYSATSTQNAIDLSLMGEVTLYGHPVFEQQYQSWLKRENYFVALEGKELASYYKILSAGLNADLGISAKKDQKEYGHWFMFSEGFLYAWSDKEYTDAEIKVLERFKNVIELTFRRYIELQKSEAQAREAVRQASLDRVRAEIASMRTISDLERITPLVWNELTILGVPFIRCGVFIIDEQEQLIHTHLSTADGKALATFNLQFDSEALVQIVVPAWRKKQIATHHWTAEEFAGYTKNLVDQGTVKSEERYVTEHPDTSLDLHFFPFLQGMLYAGNTEPLSDDDKDMVQSLADAFSTAYARYEDFNKLEAAKQEVERTLTDLKAAQTRLIQSEKMASLGELTAGIAHEIQNPLNFVNNFSEVNQEMIDELEQELNAGNIEDALSIATGIKQNEQKISHHGKRADSIVKGMLEHSRTRSGTKELININAVAGEHMRLAYHGLRAKDKGFNAEMITHFDPDLPRIQAVGQDIGRVILNLFNNAFYAVGQKSKTGPPDYKPKVTITTASEDGRVIIKVKDNGIGMPEQVKEKIMQPFFTTKPTGEGTGLGLSLTYDMVVKGHGGSIQVNSVEGEGSEFIIHLPI